VLFKIALSLKKHQIDLFLVFFHIKNEKKNEKENLFDAFLSEKHT
jgi:hypothetical protein